MTSKGWWQNCKNKRLLEKDKAKPMFAFLFTSMKHYEQQQDFPQVECSTIIAANQEKRLCKQTAYD